MDTKNWRVDQGTKPSMDNSDWRGQLLPESRQIVVNRIMDTLRHLPGSGQEGLHELRKIAQSIEEKFFTAATSQDDYCLKVYSKMLSLETKFLGNKASNLPSDQVGPNNKPSDPGLVLQSRVYNPGQQHPLALPNQPQSRQQLQSQNTQNNIASQPILLPVSSMAQTPIQNVGQNSNMQNVFASSLRQMPGRQQVVPQQQQQSQNPQQQHNLLRSNQLKSSQQSTMQTSPVMQPSMMQTSSLSKIQHNQQSNNVQQSTQSMLQQQPQVIRQQQQQQQTSILHQQQTPMAQQVISAPQKQRQQKQLWGSQANPTNMQHTQMPGPESNDGNMQQPQRLLAQQNNLSSLQQQQQQLINQQNNLSNKHQQLGNSVPGLQPQQVLGPQSGESGMQTSQHSAHMIQHSMGPVQQRSQQKASNLLPSQMQQSRPQALQQQLMPQIQSQPAQLQQQLGLQQQPNPLQRDMLHRLLASGSLRQQQSVLDEQKQLYQSQRPLQETSSTSMDSTAQTGLPSGSDWQEEVYQKIKTMKESYLPELFDFNVMYHNHVLKLPQLYSLPPEQRSDQLTKMKEFKTSLDCIITPLLVSKSDISPDFKERLGSFEKHIINFINTYRPMRAMSSLQPGQLPPTHMHSMSQPQSQVSQVKTHENQTISQLQATNIQGSVATMQQNSMTSMQHSTVSGVFMAQQNTMNSMQPVTNLGSGQGNAMNSLQQVPVSSLQPNPVSAPQQSNTNSLSSQGGVTVIQSNLNPFQEGSSMLQHQQLKQQQKPRMLQNQQYHQRQLMQRQQILQRQQQVHQPAKQQLSVQLQTHQMQRLRQTNDVTDTKMRREIGVKPGVFHQHLTSSSCSAYPLKQGSSFPVSSPQLAASPQILQHSSPQVDQGNHPPSLTKVSTPLQSANSTFVGPTPSPPLAPSSMSGDSEKPISGVSFMSNAANIGHQKTSSAAAPAQSLSIGTPGISASPLLAEFSGPVCPHGNALAPTSGTSTVTDQHIERLVKVIKSMSSKALGAAVSDISSVVSMNDRMAGPPPGNGSRFAAGKDLVAVTNCRLQDRDFTTQDAANGTRRMKRYYDATPLNVVSSASSMNDSIKQLTALEASDLESTAISSFKKAKD